MATEGTLCFNPKASLNACSIIFLQRCTELLELLSTFALIQMLGYFHIHKLNLVFLLAASFKVLKTLIEPKSVGEESSLLAEICYEEPYFNGKVTQTICCSIPAIQPWRVNNDSVVEARSGMYFLYILYIRQTLIASCKQY